MKIRQIYKHVFDDMYKEYFSGAKEDQDKSTVLKTEWTQNIRTKRNISSCLYRYKHQFLPKDPQVSISFSLYYLLVKYL